MARTPITVEEARQLVLSSILPLGSERLEIGAALHRVLAEEVVATGDVPPFACSAMDGYAVKAGPVGQRLVVTGESRAGAPGTQPLRDGQAIRISTGAAIPGGADAVIRQEDIRDESGGVIETLAPTTLGENMRGPGEDVRAGAVVLRSGSVLGASELGAA